MKKTNDFRQLDYTPGSFLTIGSPVVTEIAAQYPFTWLLLDMEHGGFTESNLIDHLRVLTQTGILSIVRIPAADPALISRVLDAGADGIMLPHVVSAEQVEACKKMMYYLPEGKRGFSSSVRQFAYGTNVPQDIAEIDKPILFAQIEDVEGVLEANKIASVDGVDVLFVGPADLKLALKYHASELSYEEALRKVAHAAIASNKKAGLLVRDKAAIGQMRQLGYSCIAIDSDMAILRAGYEAIKHFAGIFSLILICWGMV